MSICKMESGANTKTIKEMQCGGDGDERGTLKNSVISKLNTL